MDTKLNDTMNASQMLHLALQKMDGIIATNSDLESLSAKSDLVLSNENVNFEPQSPSLKQCNFKIPTGAMKNNNSTSIDTNANKSPNYNKKQDKLNRLLQELKDYSQDCPTSADISAANQFCDTNNIKTWSGHGHGHPNISKMENDKHTAIETQSRVKSYFIQETLANNNGNNPVLNSSEDKLHQPLSLPDKSSIATPEYYRHSPELAEQDRNSNYLQQLGPTNDTQFPENPQADRIAQLESIVSILRNQLLNTEDLFKKALLSKKTLEGANCDLLTIVDKFKLDLSHSEGRRKLIEEHNVRLEVDIETLKTRLLEKDTEASSLRLTMAKIVRSTGYVLSDNELALLRGKTIASDFIKNKLIKDAYAEGVYKPPMSKNNAFYSEPSSRRESFSSTLCGRSSPGPVRFHSARPSPSSTPPSRANQSRNVYGTATDSSMLRSTSVENMKVNSEQGSATTYNSPEHRARSEDKQPNKFTKNMYSTLPHNSRALKQIQKQLEEGERQAELEKQACYANDEMRFMSQSLMDEQLNCNKALSMPSSPVTTFKSSMHTTTPVQTATGAVTFAKDDEIIPPSLQSSTAELARNGIAPPRILINDSKPKGFKKIFSRKRSTSSLAGLSDAFSRGGLRATSGPRLGFTNIEKKFENIDQPFSQWDTTLVADWFAVIGLGMYVAECKRWCKNGEHLMRATSAEVEKDLGIRNMLHRKKLRLAVAAMNDEEDQLLKNAAKLDYLWVARWLDDIGLPQYKDAFLDARIDGRVLHYLTVEDLFYLKVNSQLHFASIRAGIRILRENKYNSQCLKRRAVPEEAQESDWQTSEVALWSSHRVMEWLRSIDLSEYAPNLRGSGVHGALILYENAFNSDLFATLLSIPTNKTLLRRHISAKFKQLIGEELNKVKRDYECQPHYSPMIPGAKVKAYKKGHFTLMRKKRSDYELTDYVCPMSPVISTRTKLISMIQDSKSNTSKSEQQGNSSEWKDSYRANSASTKSIQKLESAKNGTSDSHTSNSAKLTNSNNRCLSEEFASKSDSELDELSTNKKESVIT